jgi:hypothetical protein
LTVKGSTHLNYTDLNFLFPELKRLGPVILGKGEKYEMNDIINAYTLAFFNKCLLNKDEPILEDQVVCFKKILRKISDIRKCEIFKEKIHAKFRFCQCFKKNI